ncbi:MAG: S-layer homology domain-containing protein, partial [Oscillospiraceae bacterium]|nr:S-layer homology domain-containing protein [Oscillospiraceae bacterium]
PRNAHLFNKFSDTEEISSWAYDAMKWACGIRFVDGKENNNIDPTGNATRVEMAALIMRFIEYVL